MWSTITCSKIDLYSAGMQDSAGRRFTEENGLVLYYTVPWELCSQCIKGKSTTTSEVKMLSEIG